MADEAAWQPCAGGIEVRLRVTPRGGRDGLDGLETLADGRQVLKVRVRAAPEDGAANEGVRRLLAQALRSPQSAVGLVSGARARVKIYRVEGEARALAASLDALTRDCA